MKPTDVTDEINEAVCEAVGHYGWDGVNQKEIIAASVNAFFGDPTPITAEWLVARGWLRSYTFKDSFYHMAARRFCVWFGSEGVVYAAIGETSLDDVKTIGQLRALEIGLGIKQCQ